MKIKKHNINNRIRAQEVRLIDQNGENLGTKSIRDAMTLAREANLDLVEVSGSTKPPVCKILDYNKYLYEQKSKEKKTKVKKTDLKEFKLSPKISEGDMNMRIRRGKGFLETGNMVKYTVKFKGRERKYPEIGLTKLKIIESELAEVSAVENPPKMLGHTMSMTLMPKKA